MKEELTQTEKEILLDLLDSARIEALLEENKFDPDDLGLLMAKLGRKDMIDVYLDDK